MRTNTWNTQRKIKPSQDFIDECFSVLSSGCVVISSYYRNRFAGSEDEWNLLVSCVEDNISDEGKINSIAAFRDYEISIERRASRANNA